MVIAEVLLTSGCSFTGTYNFSDNVTIGPAFSGKLKGSRALPLLWNRHNLTLLISEKRKTGIKSESYHHSNTNCWASSYQKLPDLDLHELWTYKETNIWHYFWNYICYPMNKLHEKLQDFVTFKNDNFFFFFFFFCTKHFTSPRAR